MIYSSKTSKTSSNHTIINVENLTVNYNNIEALKDITFKLSKQDYLYIVGPNGGGKSTLVKSLLKLVKPSIGKIEMSTNKIGYLPQLLNNKTNFPITVLEVIYTGFNKQNLFINNIDKTLINEWLKRIEMYVYRNSQFNTLSGGQKQRILLIRALISSPDLLILDEPTSALDPEFRSDFYKLINEINMLGTTIIFITHDLNNNFNKDSKVLKIDQEIEYFGPVNDYLTYLKEDH